MDDVMDTDTTSPHLTDDEIKLLVNGEADPALKERARRHNDGCYDCADHLAARYVQRQE